MKKYADRLFGSPSYLKSLLFFAQYGAVLQFLASFFFLGFSRNGGPLGCLEASRALNEAALVTLTLAVSIRIFVFFLRRCGMKL